MSERLRRLHRARPRSRFVRASAAVGGLCTAYVWCSGAVEAGDFLSARRRENLVRFLTEDSVPFPLRGEGFDLAGAWSWAGEVLGGRGLQAAVATVAIATVAIALAGVLSGCLAPLAAATVATERPFEPAAGGGRPAWRALRLIVRAGMIVMRSIPEYVLAFLLLAVLGPNHAWPAVLALALHNGAILGRLGAEAVENLEPGPLRSLRGLGASRRSILAAGVFPLALGNYLLYFFYRFETCVREATVLGMLGVVSLGFYIQDARAKLYYDEMLLLIGLGSVIVLAADWVSSRARRYLRSGV
ncbi:MAG: ABC transporter permease subunit [Planctomycetota bacterium]|jgi:phosphonate transport system permease protein|nr:ABC transporter permease subunit [Planctomycetota bacterium]MDP6989458.1 ABC transporter permease subunit [Planctomycetota bacterium]